MKRDIYTKINDELMGRYGNWSSVIIEEITDQRLHYHINVGNDTDVAYDFNDLLHIIVYWIYRGHEVNINGFEYEYSIQEQRIVNEWIKQLKNIK